MSRPHTLIVDDEPAIRQTLGSYLTKRGYATATASSGEEALDSVQSRRPDLVLLDLVMPGIGGLEACRRIRARSSVPIIVLSVIDREPEKVEALEAGADDYLTKPFGPDELVARIGVALRHRAGLASGVEPVYRCGDLTVDLGNRNVTLGGGQIRLTLTEYDVLRCLAAASGRTLAHGQLLREIWGPEHETEIQLLRFAVFQLRKKLADDPLRPRYIMTVPGIGYQFGDAPPSG